MYIRTLQFGWYWNLKITVRLKTDTSPKFDKSYEDKKKFHDNGFVKLIISSLGFILLFSHPFLLNSEKWFFLALLALFGLYVNLCPVLVYWKMGFSLSMQVGSKSVVNNKSISIMNKRILDQWWCLVNQRFFHLILVEGEN